MCKSYWPHMNRLANTAILPAVSGTSDRQIPERLAAGVPVLWKPVASASRAAKVLNRGGFAWRPDPMSVVTFCCSIGHRECECWSVFYNEDQLKFRIACAVRSCIWNNCRPSTAILKSKSFAVHTADRELRLTVWIGADQAQ